MFKFALKNMGVKKVQIILIVISIIISASVGVLAFNVSTQVSEGITTNAGYYSVIVGPSGSKTQLAMNTMYFTDDPLGTIPYSVVNELERDSRVRRVIPYAMADSYNGSKIVGTASAFLDGKELADGVLFTDGEICQAVIGSRVAKNNNLKVGDTFKTEHVGMGAHDSDMGIKVVGILNESFSAYDNVIFTQLQTLWAVHKHGKESGEGTGGDVNHGHVTEEDESHGHEDESHGGEGHENEEHEHSSIEGMVCAILINTRTPNDAIELVTEYTKAVNYEGHVYSLQAIEPMEQVRDVLNDADNTKYIVYVLSAVILIMNIIVISIITLLNMYHSAKEISLMRLIGISMKKINLLYIIQNSIIGLFSTLIAFGVSRLCLIFMGDYVASMGAVLNLGKVYPFEILILAGIFLISVIPTVICTFVMAKRDSLAE